MNRKTKINIPYLVIEIETSIIIFIIFGLKTLITFDIGFIIGVFYAIIKSLEENNND